MKISEKALLDGYICKTRGTDNVSEIRGHEITWNYRTGPTPDGYNSVCTRDRASEITLECDRRGKVRMSGRWNHHPAVARIAADEARLWGGEV